MIEITKIERIGKGALIARFDVKMHKWGGLVIRDCALFESNGKKWMNLPSKPYEADGKKKYLSYIFYEDREIDQKFKDMIMEAAHAALPPIIKFVDPEHPNEIEELPF